ncbi:MAG: 16S rRNA (adenine(1518)-N(6)/adenine(1519)-N(6))-dimethyltransferase RsmA [Magnetococcales bacterium]|nr:16S rRNA (adenine(1518)-N(6)/adenine(1519)-N(6))-dimethyltransferase RsmA [Magnetococcales bacterium]
MNGSSGGHGVAVPAAKKRLGQHFLADSEVAREIVRASGVGPGDRVVEIGPGPGALTVWLLRAAGRVWAIELDAELLPVLMQRTAGLGELHVERTDALRVDYGALAETLGGELRIVANLPYNISTPLLMRFIDQRAAIVQMTLMVQTEVAERLYARPGTKAYGALSVPCGLWMEIEPVLHVPPGAFRPPPKVNSTVVRLTRRAAPLARVDDPGIFSQVVRAAFGQRRKVLANALRVMGDPARQWLERAEIDPERRGETLSIPEFARLANVIHASGGSDSPDHSPTIMNADQI